MNSPPKISIIIPAFNAEQTLQETLQSVIQQTFTDWELILVDDGSTDQTLSVAAQISDPRIQVYSYPNAGAQASRNRGMKHAQGAFITFLDADDLWTPHKLAAQLQALQEHPEAALAYSWTDYIDESSHFLQAGRHLSYDGQVFEKLLLIDFLENGSNPLIRRQALLEVGEFDESLSGGQDWDMWLRLAEHYPFTVVKEAQILYRLSHHSTSANLVRQERQCIKVLEKALSHATDQQQSLKKVSLCNLYKYLAWKALEGDSSWANRIAAMRYILKYAIFQKAAWREWKFIEVMLTKAAIKLLTGRLVSFHH